MQKDRLIIIHEIIDIPTEKESYCMMKLNKPFKWDNKNSFKFSQGLQNSVAEIDEIKQRIEAGLINSSGKKLQELFFNTGKNLLETYQPQAKF